MQLPGGSISDWAVKSESEKHVRDTLKNIFGIEKHEGIFGEKTLIPVQLLDDFVLQQTPMGIN